MAEKTKRAEGYQESREANQEMSANGGQEIHEPTSAMIAERGIRTASDFAQFMGALMEDLVHKRVSPAQAQAACLAGSTLLKVVRLQLEYGDTEKDGSRHLSLTGQRQLTTAKQN
jgi:hypothetical protein